MSHIAKCEVVVNSIAAFRAAVEALGGTFHEGQKTHKWYNIFVGDTPMPEGMTKADLGKCDHAASFPGCSYEVGLRANGDGTFTMAFDYWRAGGLSEALGGDALPKLCQAYSREKVLADIPVFGHALESETRLADGTIELEAIL